NRSLRRRIFDLSTPPAACSCVVTLLEGYAAITNVNEEAARIVANRSLIRAGSNILGASFCVRDCESRPYTPWQELRQYKNFCIEESGRHPLTLQGFGVFCQAQVATVYGVLDGLVCSDAGTREGSGLSGDVCRWTAFQSLPILRKTIVMRPVSVSGVPLKTIDCVH